MGIEQLPITQLMRVQMGYVQRILFAQSSTHNPTCANNATFEALKHKTEHHWLLIDKLIPLCSL